jgi:hypothetical protein
MEILQLIAVGGRHRPSLASLPHRPEIETFLVESARPYRLAGPANNFSTECLTSVASISFILQLPGSVATIAGPPG